MPRPDKYPEAKAIVQEAAINDMSLTGAAALRMLHRLQTAEVNHGRTLEVPDSEKTCARWIAALPEHTPWNGDESNPAEFRVIARCIRELTKQNSIQRMFTKAEAKYVGRFGQIAPDLPPLSLWRLSQLAISMEANEMPIHGLTSWLIYSVSDVSDSKSYPSRDWVDMYEDMKGTAFPELPDHLMDVFKPEMKGSK